MLLIRDLTTKGVAMLTQKNSLGGFDRRQYRVYGKDECSGLAKAEQ